MKRKIRKRKRNAIHPVAAVIHRVLTTAATLTTAAEAEVVEALAEAAEARHTEVGVDAPLANLSSTIPELETSL